MTLHILLDKTNYNSKPSSKEIGLINNRLNNLSTQITIEDFAAQITFPNGKSYCPAIFNGSRSNENWISQQIFALDFDDGITFNEIQERLNEYGLDCTFSYHTFSSTTELQKFRVIWQTDLVTDINERNAIQFCLMNLFPESDKSCKDPARLYFGGKELIYENYNYILDTAQLNDSVRCCVVKNSSLNNLNRDLKRFDKKWIKSGIPNIYTITKTENNPKATLQIDWGELRDKIKIVDDFLSGKKTSST